jgi:hypothetical protein
VKGLAPFRKKGDYNSLQKPVKQRGAGKKGGLSENRDIGNLNISEIDISDTSDVIISDLSISDISIGKNGHIGLDKSEFRYIHIGFPIYP